MKIKTLKDISKELIYGFVYNAEVSKYKPDDFVASYQMSGGWMLFVCTEKLFKYRENNGTTS